MRKLICLVFAVILTVVAVSVPALAAENYTANVVTRNGRVYAIVKIWPVVEKSGDVWLTDVIKYVPVTQVPNFLVLSRVGYMIALVQDYKTTDQKLIPLVQVDSESVKYDPVLYPDMAGKEVDGIGSSLGMEAFVDLEYATTVPQLVAAARQPLMMSVVGNTLLLPTGEVAFTEERLAQVITALEDFELKAAFMPTTSTPETGAPESGVIAPDDAPDVAEATLETAAE